ncbi:unnamed protein product [Rotaria sordida]|uniref:Uncharacterized protein n=1 Tax=Rotaria sordida TaxID=392033 RepID=A0A815EZY1_9BILA|nr:unnamed protein product [Rotaria sordida]CAF3741700.1 unnamed protein product [Rotaria sordida]
MSIHLTFDDQSIHEDENLQSTNVLFGQVNSTARLSQAVGTTDIQDIGASDLTNFISGFAASDDIPSDNPPSSSTLGAEILHNAGRQHPSS